MAQSESQDGEVISSLRLAGFHGTVRTVLLPERLLLEHANGAYLRMDYDKISKMRHHQFAVIPHWTAMIAFLAIYAALRVLTGPLQLWIGLSAAAVLIAWLAIRLPALTVDAAEDGCYTLFGPERQLLRLRLVIERIQDGTAFNEAFEGLNELIYEEYPSSGVFADLFGVIPAIPADDAQLVSAMTELMTAQHDEDAADGALMLDASTEDAEALQILNMDPMGHGSIVRARQVRQDVTIPRHQGWTNVAHRVEPIDRYPPSTSPSSEPAPQPQPAYQPNFEPAPQPQPAYQPNFEPASQHQPAYQPNFEQEPPPYHPPAPSPSMFSEQPEQPSALDTMFGFDLGSDPEVPEQESMFSDVSPAGPAVGDWIQTGEYDRPSPATSQFGFEKTRPLEQPRLQEQAYGPEPAVERPSTFINSFQSTGDAAPLNQLDASLYERNREVSEPGSPAFSHFSNGVVSQAKLGENEVIEAEPVECTPASPLKRINRQGGRKLKRLDAAGGQRRNVSLKEVIAPVWRIKVPAALRGSRSKAEDEPSIPPPPQSGRTLDALRIQAQHSHEAQIAHALRGLSGIATEKQVADLLLEDVAPDLIEDEIPLSFGQMTSTSDSSEGVNLPGVTRLD